MGIRDIAELASALTAIATCLAVFIAPIRNRIFGLRDTREGSKCLLRDAIVRIYYGNLNNKTLRQFEWDNLVYCYRAYKQLGGNSFVDRLYREMLNWGVTR